MINRYTLPPMRALWNDEQKFKRWLDVELAVLECLEKQHLIPANVTSRIRSKAKIKVKKINQLESVVHHDVIAFTTSIAEQVGDVGRYFHYGLTSSDVVDTALSLLILDALKLISDALDKLQIQFKLQALKYRTLPSIGRTHGIHAEPTSFGLKFLGWFAEFQRHQERLKTAMENIRYGKLSGAVGSYGALSPEIELHALKNLGLKVEDVATQVLPRDRHAAVFCSIAEIGSSIERVAVELRHLQRTEVNEVEEQFRAGQKGSSAMPHKKNPISSENLTGCARLLRGYALSSLENVALWHERDISHSSVERVIAPDATILLHYMLERLSRVISNLKVNKESVAENIDRTHGIFFSGHLLLHFVKKGMSRESAYRIVQKHAHSAWNRGQPFKDELWKDKRVKALFTRSELDRVFQVKNYLKNVDSIYTRVLGDGFKGTKQTKKNAKTKKKKKK